MNRHPKDHGHPSGLRATNERALLNHIRDHQEVWSQDHAQAVKAVLAQRISTRRLQDGREEKANAPYIWSIVQDLKTRHFVLSECPETLRKDLILEFHFQAISQKRLIKHELVSRTDLGVIAASHQRMAEDVKKLMSAGTPYDDLQDKCTWHKIFKAHQPSGHSILETDRESAELEDVGIMELTPSDDRPCSVPRQNGTSRGVSEEHVSTRSTVDSVEDIPGWRFDRPGVGSTASAATMSGLAVPPDNIFQSGIAQVLCRRQDVPDVNRGSLPTRIEDIRISFDEIFHRTQTTVDIALQQIDSLVDNSTIRHFVKKPSDDLLQLYSGMVGFTLRNSDDCPSFKHATASVTTADLITSLVAAFMHREIWLQGDQTYFDGLRMKLQLIEQAADPNSMRHALKEWAELPTTQDMLMHGAANLSAALGVLAEEHLRVAFMRSDGDMMFTKPVFGSLDVMNIFTALLTKHILPVMMLAIAVKIGTALIPTPIQIYWPRANCDYAPEDMQRLRGTGARVALTVYPGLQIDSGCVRLSKVKAFVYT